METPNLPALLADLEGATGSSRELFIRVLGELCPTPGWEEPWTTRMADLVRAEAWTDAALALVERVMPGIPTRCVLGGALGHAGRWEDARGGSLSKWLPLAILSVSLRLLIEEVERGSLISHLEKESSHAG